MADKRKSRFHTENNVACFDPLQIAMAFSTTSLRKLFNYHVPVPWLILPALRFLAAEIPDKDVFEFGSGMSTRWYAKRCRRITSIEDSAEWYERQRDILNALPNVKVLFEPDEGRYVNKLEELGRKFDVIIVDGSYRLRCLESSIPYVNRNGCIVVDNTDQQDYLARFIRETFSPAQVTVMSGWAPGSFYAKETTVIRVA